MSENKSVDYILFQIKELGKQIEAVGFLIEYCEPENVWPEVAHLGLGTLLSRIGIDIQHSSEGIFEELVRRGVELTSQKSPFKQEE